MGRPEKHSVTIRGHRTSFSLENAFFSELERLARARGMTVAALIAEIDATRAEGTNLSSALRLYVLESLKREAGSSNPEAQAVR